MPIGRIRISYHPETQTTNDGVQTRAHINICVPPAGTIKQKRLCKIPPHVPYSTDRTGYKIQPFTKTGDPRQQKIHAVFALLRFSGEK